MKSFGRKKEPPQASPWHPDFRDPSALPDVKPIRTSFFVNGIAAVVALVLAVALGYVELKRVDYNRQIRMLEDQIAENRSDNREAVRLQQQFDENAELVRGILEFYDAPMAYAIFLETLGATLPEEFLITNIRYSDYEERGARRGKEIRINGTVLGTPDEASERVSDYLLLFEDHPVLSEGVTNARLTSLAPTQEGGRMAYGIQLLFENETEDGNE